MVALIMRSHRRVSSRFKRASFSSLSRSASRCLARKEGWGLAAEAAPVAAAAAAAAAAVVAAAVAAAAAKPLLLLLLPAA